jgi:hypothetical protein
MLTTARTVLSTGSAAGIFSSHAIHLEVRFLANRNLVKPLTSVTVCPAYSPSRAGYEY